MKVSGSITRGLFLACVFAASANIAAAQFTDSFGNAGAVRKFQGQIRDSLDQSVFGAVMVVKNVATGETFELTVDENGVFRKANLAQGDYEVRIRATGFNFAEYTVRIDPAGSKRYIVTRLSPGCATGDSGLVLLKSLKDRSVKN